MRLETNGVNAGVGSQTTGHLLEFVEDVILVEVDCVSLSFRRSHGQTVDVVVDCNYAIGAEQVGALNCELTYWSTTPNGNGVSFLYLAVLSCHISSRENVREKQHLFIRKMIGNLQRADVSERYANILGLASGIPAHHVGIAEESRTGEAIEEIGHSRIWIRVVACGPELTF